MSVYTSSLIFLFTLIASKSYAFQNVKGIVNGLDVMPAEIPYQVSLQYSMISMHFCGGSIINDYYVVTAAHCMHYLLLEDISAVVGTTNLDEPKWTYKVISTIVHEKFKIPNHFANDIALLKVDRRFEFNEFVLAVKLAEPHEKIPYHQKALATGWGLNSTSNSDESVTLKKVEVTLVEQTYCSDLYDKIERPVYSVQFCTHDVGPIRKATCTSIFLDSIKGHHGMALNTVKKYRLTLNNVLIGIVSWSRKDPECGSPKYPDVHTRVSEFIDWINEHAV